MITIDDFRSIPPLARRIRREQEHLLYLREKATSIPSVMPNPNKVQTTRENRAGMYIDAAIDLANDIKVLENELRMLQGRVEPYINSLDNRTARKVMMYRYIDLYDWDVIADVMGYTMRWVQKLEQKAISELTS